MTTSRIDWPAALVRGARIIPLVTIEGVPVLLTPAGVHPTAAAFTGDPDPAWWLNASSGDLAQAMPGGTTLDPVREWLDPSQVFEVYEEARALDGDTHVDPMTFTVYDKGAEATSFLSVQQARLTALLGSEIGPADTTIPLSSGASSAPASGIACIGREAIVYSATGGGSLLIGSAPDGRGRFGSVARRHTVPPTHPPLVSFGGPRFWQSRRAVVWAAALSADGLTVSDPTPLFIGTVGAGVQLVSGGVRWSIPLDPISESYTRKWTPRTVSLFGIAHFYPDFTQPLQVGWLHDTYLDSQNDSINNLGWHQNWGDFLNDFHLRAQTTEGTALNPVQAPRLTLFVSGGSSNQLLTVVAAWNTPPYVERYVDTSERMTFAQDPPEACLHLDGRVRLPLAGDIDLIPSTLQWAVSDPSPGAAYLALSAKTDHTDLLTARILSRTSSPPEVVVRAQFPANRGRDVTRAEARQQAVLITKRTSASLAVIATGETALGALKVLALALSEVSGTDLQGDSIDWADLARVFARYPTVINQQREYRLASGDTLLDLLVQECRLRGFAMAIRYGRITAYRPSSFASTEPTRATITKADVLLERDGSLSPWDVIDNTQPLASTVSFELPDGSVYAWVDTTFQGEFGDGAEVKITALKHLPSTVDVTNLPTGLQSVAWQLLGPLAEPGRLVRLPLPPTFLHLQPGDLVTLTHDMVPTWVGTRGVEAMTCQVVEVRRQLWGGKARAIVGLRLQSQDLSGYAPEALIAAGGLDHSSRVITLDTASGFGPSCFARNVDVDGNAVSDPTDGFVIGQKVLLSEIDTESPAADEAFTIQAVDPIGHTITLSGYPSLAMAALAAAQYKVILRFDSWSNVITSQKKYAFIADAATGLLGGVDPAKVWAA